MVDAKKRYLEKAKKVAKELHVNPDKVDFEGYYDPGQTVRENINRVKSKLSGTPSLTKAPEIEEAEKVEPPTLIQQRPPTLIQQRIRHIEDEIEKLQDDMNKKEKQATSIQLKKAKRQLSKAWQSVGMLEGD